MQVLKETEFTCSAGIAHNKVGGNVINSFLLVFDIFLNDLSFSCQLFKNLLSSQTLAKLASAMNKPAQQTVVPFSSVKGLLDSLPIKKM